MSPYVTSSYEEAERLKSANPTKVHDPIADYHISRILYIHTTLQSLSDLSPSTNVNALFSELVGLCIQILGASTTNSILTDQRVKAVIHDLRHLCSTAESLLEAHWATFISNATDFEDAQARLKQFPYHQNYDDLTRLELSALAPYLSTEAKTFAFIGSGPLPLTSMCLLSQLTSNSSPSASASPTEPSQILNVDHSASAITLSRRLATALGMTPQLSFSCAEADGPLDLGGFDVVWLAALVGETQQEKEDVLIRVVRRMKEGALVIVRSSWGLRGLLYPEFDVAAPAISDCLEICQVVHPYTSVVNSAIVGRVRPQAGNEIASSSSPSPIQNGEA